MHLPQTGAPPSEIVRIARRAEEAGWDSLWVSDHALVPASGGELPPVELDDPVTLLVWVAASTRSIRIGTSVLVLPYRHPVQLAKQLATLDRLCGGRVVAGVASGWLEAEFRALGAPWERRGEYTDEAIDLMRALWASEQPEFHGSFFSVSGMRFGPRPTGGRVPLWVGGTSRRAMRRAVERGDGWHGSRLSPEGIAERVRWLGDAAAGNGRSLAGFTISTRVYVGFGERYLETGGYLQGVLAPPPELAAHLDRLAAAGVEELLVTPLPFGAEVDSFLDRFEREVRPRLASAPAKA
ncbi:MAG: LLM class F420-dependent oxidoreductase [Deltaproteobacteria bacterium]|nr:LLM class F420-dependent oxidoreductase [Deltaproteobacteria bacterium]